MSSDEPTVQELFDLRGRTALITGGTGWLGSAMGRALAEAGSSVVMTSRDPKKAEKAAEQLPVIAHAQHRGVGLDHMHPDTLQSGFEAAVSAAGQIDVLVNNALQPCARDLAETSFDEFSHHQANNAGYFELARCVHDHAVAHRRSASIILIASMYGMVGSYPDAYRDICSASPVAYHALKGGTIQMARHLAVYWARDNVRVNCLSPGPFPQADVPQALIDRLEQKSPMARMGQPFELKGALLFLASDAGSYVTGQNIVVDGGWTAW